MHEVDHFFIFSSFSLFKNQQRTCTFSSPDFGYTEDEINKTGCRWSWGNRNRNKSMRLGNYYNWMENRWDVSNVENHLNCKFFWILSISSSISSLVLVFYLIKVVALRQAGLGLLSQSSRISLESFKSLQLDLKLTRVSYISGDKILKKEEERVCLKQELFPWQFIYFRVFQSQSPNYPKKQFSRRPSPSKAQGLFLIKAFRLLI